MYLSSSLIFSNLVRLKIYLKYGIVIYIVIMISNQH
ncbi:Uncharacterised protein [Vibrio cholerae]|uniref:Uncharacterized protein n=1 Tax=Vibrio cholerae TaxID=666 RepID=A0A655ZHB8_VIBCL|nr:Uncharacterised protein [Vibrio cholerae]